MSGFIAVVDGEDVLEMPLESDGTLLISTLQSQFGGATGLRYLSPDGSHVRGVRFFEGRLYAPDDGWNDHVYTVTYSRGTREILDALRNLASNVSELLNRVEDTIAKQRASMTYIDKTINELEEKLFKEERQTENSEKQKSSNDDGNTSENGAKKKEEKKGEDQTGQETKEEENKGLSTLDKNETEQDKDVEKTTEKKSDEDEEKDDGVSQGEAGNTDRKRKYEPPSAFELYQIDYFVAHAHDGKTAEELRDDARISWDNANKDVRRIYESKAKESLKRHKDD